MPEGHTLHALAGRLRDHVVGERLLVASPQGRFAGEAAELDGRMLLASEAFGKHLLLTFEGDRLVHIHLGLFGKFSVQAHRRRGGGAPEDLPVRGQVRLRLVGLTHVGDLRGPTVCELIDPAQWRLVRRRIGADPLRSRRLPTRTVAALRATKRPVALVLMDQSLIAGVGNVYRAELLHARALDPFQPSATVPDDLWRQLWRDLVRLMPLGVQTGRILVNDADVRRARALLRAGGTGRLRPSYAVYRRTGHPCPRCGETVATQVVGGRNLFWCPGCQVRQGE